MTNRLLLLIYIKKYFVNQSEFTKKMINLH